MFLLWWPVIVQMTALVYDAFCCYDGYLLF